MSKTGNLLGRSGNVLEQSLCRVLASDLETGVSDFEICVSTVF